MVSIAQPSIASAPRPEIEVVFESRISLNSESIGISIPALTIDISALRPLARDSVRVEIPSGWLDLEMQVNFWSLKESVTAVASLVGENVRRIRVLQNTVSAVSIDIDHRNDYPANNCTLKCATGIPLTAPGHCIDCQGPHGTVRLCC